MLTQAMTNSLASSSSSLLPSDSVRSCVVVVLGITVAKQWQKLHHHRHHHIYQRKCLPYHPPLYMDTVYIIIILYIYTEVISNKQ